jgi:methanethiol S-methyltransferase
MLQLILLWLIFGVSHSLLASTKVRSFFEEISGGKPFIFRLFYNALSLFLLFLIIVQTLLMSIAVMVKTHFMLQIMGIFGVITGLFILFGVARQMDLKAFLGFKNETSDGILMTGGWYKIVRHPLYFGIFVLFSGIYLLFPTPSFLISFVLSQLYVIIGIEFEEKKLRRIFGQEYTAFSKGKKKFIPFVY